MEEDEADVFAVDWALDGACLVVGVRCAVRFNLLVFQPFIGEVLVGKVMSSTSDRIRSAYDSLHLLCALRSSRP